MQQYFIKRNYDGRPFDRDTRTAIYEQAKGIQEEKAYGTELDGRDGCSRGRRDGPGADRRAGRPGERSAAAIRSPGCFVTMTGTRRLIGSYAVARFTEVLDSRGA